MSLLNQWKNRPKDNVDDNPLVKAPVQDSYPLSRGQKRLFFLDRLYSNNPVYNSSEVYTFKGSLNIEKLKTSLKVIFNSNDILRCSFHFVEGQPIQKVNQELELEISEFDLSELSSFDRKNRQEEIMKTDSLRPFNLSNPPLIRASILKLAAEEYALFITIHHIITDKWSIGLFQEQLLKYYKKAPSVEELEANKSKLQFLDFAFWEQDNKVDPIQLDYWKEKLSGEIPNLELPVDYPQKANPSFLGGSNVNQLSKELSNKVLELCKKLETTPYVLLLAVYKVMLFRYSGQNDILIGSPISIRGSKELEDIVGFFDETIVLRSEVFPDETFETLVKSLRGLVLEAFSNKDVPFDRLVKELKPERSISGNPFFRSMFIYHDVEKIVFDPEIDMSYSFYNSGIAKFDLTLYVSNEAGILSTEFEYAKDLFDDLSIERFQEHFQLLLLGVTTDSLLQISEISMLTKEEQLLLEPKTLDAESLYSSYSAIQDIIVEQAKKNPNKIAVVFGDTKITYENFDKQSDLVAQQILKYSKGENQIVGLCFDRSIKMMVSLLGILKAGCAYLPLDLNYPAKRIDFILEDSDVKILLTQKHSISKFENFTGEILQIENQEFKDSEVHNDIVLPQPNKDNLAYVIYTSGSTGKPKGVPITHANIISSNEARLDFYPENPTAFLLMSSISFDSSKAGVFWTLCTGGTLVISKEGLEQNIEELSQVIQSNSVSHTLMLPSLYKTVLELSKVETLKSLKAVVVAGEECTPILCQEHFKKLPETELYNEYGPTEATVWCIAYKIEKDVNEAIIPIGKATSNAEVYLLNSEMKAVPYGAIGEIYIGGKGLSKTYLNRPELTKSAYVPHPFSNNTKDVLYKTGDLGRYRNDGAIEFLGRTDHQVKIRGFRIELNEIENALIRIEVIHDAIVMAETTGSIAGSNSSKRLVAYVLSNQEIDGTSIKNTLSSEIPSYMVPASIIQLEKFPELPNGKVDKKALLGLSQAIRESSSSVKPTNEIETKLVDIWKEVLNQSDIGIYDNYFEIGGDSMASIKMFWLIEKVMNVKLSPSILFINPTIQKIALQIQKDTIQNIEDLNHIVPYRVTGSKRPLFCIHGGEGHVLFYQNFADHLSSDRPVYLVQPKGVNGEEELHLSIEQMATEYLKEIITVSQDDTINLVFYCCGALVVEMSNQLEEMGKIPNIIIIDSSPEYKIDGADSEKNLRYNFFLKRLLKNPIATIKKSLVYRFRRKVVPIYYSLIKNDLEKRQIKIRTRLEEVQQNYNWKTFDAQCTLILGKEGLSEFDQKDIEGWNHWCKSEVTVVYNSGNHFNIFELPHAIALGETAETACI